MAEKETDIGFRHPSHKTNETCLKSDSGALYGVSGHRWDRPDWPETCRVRLCKAPCGTCGRVGYPWMDRATRAKFGV